MRQRLHSQAGFNLPELMIAMAVMLLIAGAATTALLKMGTTQATIWNRTQMHSGIRGATEVLQQEVGQAGRISLTTSGTTCTNNLTVPCITQSVSALSTAQSVTVNSVCGMFIGEKVTVDSGDNQETVTITQINGGTSDPNATTCPTAATISAGSISAIFTANHTNNPTPLQALGGFINGIVPDTITNGSSAAVLKLFGDINADGNMVYVEYSVSPACICSNTCTPTSTTGNLYRNSMAWNKASKTAASASQILLGNITANPYGTACFTYQPANVVISGVTYKFITDVAVTLTVQTQQIDPVTRDYQKETKALLNVSPRNVFATWEMASMTFTDRMQATPTVTANLFAGSGS